NGLAFKNSYSLPVKSLYLKDLSLESSLSFLESIGISASPTNLEELWRRYSGNPYALRVVSTTIKHIFDGNLAHFLSKGHCIYGEIRLLIEQQYIRLSQFEKLVMQNITLVSLRREQAQCSFAELEHSFTLKEDAIFLIEALESLYYRSFIHRQDANIIQPQILREYIQHFVLP
ncbi:MAG: hypothetical protein WCD18_28280, partial [Thermosynechococcaceae cyanobacterium]